MNRNLLDIIGQRIGKLLIVSFAFSKKKGNRVRRYYNCLCECGKTKIVVRDSLIDFNTKSCGCLGKESKDKINKDLFNKRGSSLYKYLYTLHRGQAKYRDLEFTLSFEEFKDLISKNCHYCKEPPSNLCRVKRYYGELYYNGIDRKDNSKGYTAYNSLSCCFICNRAKNDMKYEDFLEYLKRFKHVG